MLPVTAPKTDLSILPEDPVERRRALGRINQARYRENNPESYRAKEKRWRERNPEKVKAKSVKWREQNRDKHLAAVRSWQLRNRYGITPEEYDRVLALQSGVCAICKQERTRKFRLCVDHDHKTGAARGLLCNHCNRALGLLKDSVSVLTEAIAYLKGRGK